MLTRRTFNTGVGASALAAALPGPAAAAPAYSGPNVILIRFGGGVRRFETIEARGSFAPFLVNTLVPRGVLIPDMRIERLEDVNTSHAEGTLNLLTGRYLAYRDAGSRFLDDRLEPTEPTLFEYLRKAFDLPSHQVLLVNGEDRPQEEFFTFSPAGHYGIDFRSEMLSLHRYKLYKYARILEEGGLDEKATLAARDAYQALLAADRRKIAPQQSAAVRDFWSGWRADHGDDGLRNPRGDRLLTALAVRAMASLKPRFMMVNYQDTDYVHWGNASHYTRAISIIDQGLARIVAAAEADDFYRGNTVFCVVPDCGRDANALMSVPFQHHFNSRSAHEIWALFFGAGITRGRIMDRVVDQTAVAATLAAIMGLRAERAEGEVLAGLAR